MKYPIDIEAIAAECKALYPNNAVIEPILRAVLPMVNEAYEQGRSEICDNLCRHPRECANQEELDEHCSGCQTLVDLQNLVERLEVDKQ